MSQATMSSLTLGLNWSKRQNCAQQSAPTTWLVFATLLWVGTYVRRPGPVPQKRGVPCCPGTEACRGVVWYGPWGRGEPWCARGCHSVPGCAAVCRGVPWCAVLVCAGKLDFHFRNASSWHTSNLIALIQLERWLARMLLPRGPTPGTCRSHSTEAAENG
jgi:hypothetical protein